MNPLSSQAVLEKLRRFRDDRDWSQFHTPDALAKSIAIEAGELLECFQWETEIADYSEARMELADVLTYCYFLADLLGEKPEELILEKLALTQVKYPVPEGED